MDRKSTIIVLVISFSFVILMVITAYLTSGISPIKSTATKKRFSAPPGKSMETSLVLVSKKRESTFSEENVPSSTESNVKNIQVSSIGKGDEESQGANPQKEGSQPESIPQQTTVKISEELRNLLQSTDPTQQTEKLDEIINSVKDPQYSLKILNNNLDILLSKGLTDWVEAKLNEIVSSASNEPTTASEANFMLAHIELTKGNKAKAEELLEKAWKTITSSNPKENEELVRLIGLNYARLLINNDKKEAYNEVVQYIQKNFPKTASTYTKTQLSPK